MSIKWIEYKGKKILYADYRGISNEEEMLNNFEEEIKNISTHNNVLVLDDFRDSYLGNNFVKKAKEEGSKVKLKMKKHALIGINGFKGFLLKKTFKKYSHDNTVSFPSEYVAKEFLVNE